MAWPMIVAVFMIHFYEKTKRAKTIAFVMLMQFIFVFADFCAMNSLLPL